MNDARDAAPGEDAPPETVPLETAPLAIDLGARSYPIHIEPGALDRADALLAPLLRPGRRVVVVTDDVVAATDMPSRLEAALARAGVETLMETTPSGERAKSVEGFGALCEAILARGIDRGALVVALGGGVVGDLAGYVAASLLRGLDFVQIPTTLLAQVDSSVGGKTGINAAAGKNLIGAFHQPKAVLIDLDALSSLPARQMRAGYAEIVKYGLIADRDFFDWLEAHGDAVLAREPGALAHAVRRSCAIKAEIVAADEEERSGKRALLNLGHTFGHALEQATGYGDLLLHGEAVAIGMTLALEFSRRLGSIGADDVARGEAVLLRAGLPTWPTDVAEGGFDEDRLIALMGRDKKVVDRRLRFVLCRDLGDAFVAEDAPIDVLRPLLSDARTIRRRPGQR